MSRKFENKVKIVSGSSMEFPLLAIVVLVVLLCCCGGNFLGGRQTV